LTRSAKIDHVIPDRMLTPKMHIGGLTGAQGIPKFLLGGGGIACPVFVAG
jgi:hypothetical protein